jgi:hypothetical protein
MLLKDRGCLHAKPPDIPEYARSLASDLVGVICDYRIRPDLPMPVKLGEKERIVTSSHCPDLTRSCKLVFQHDSWTTIPKSSSLCGEEIVVLIWMFPWTKR